MGLAASQPRGWEVLAAGAWARSHTPSSKEHRVLVLCFAVKVTLAHKLPLLPSVLLSALMLVYFLGDSMCLLSRLTHLCGLSTPGSELVAGSHTLEMCNRACCFNAKDSTVGPFSTQRA